MPRRVRLPMFVLAGGLLGLIVLLATLQYRWLGQISEAERERMRATLSAGASAFAEDFDRELNRAYLLFQSPAAAADDSLAGQMATRVDRWQATSQFPRLIKDVYNASADAGAVTLKRFNPSTRFLEPAEWPAALNAVRAQLPAAETRSGGDGKTILVHSAVPALWPDAPALVLSVPMIVINRIPEPPRDLALPSAPSYTILLLDGDYIRREMLPSLAQHHFQPAGRSDYEVAVVPAQGQGSIYHSAAAFNPAKADARADASADLFHLRVQDFGPLAAEISRFTVFSAVARTGDVRGGASGHTRTPAAGERSEAIVRHAVTSVPGTLSVPPGSPMSIIVQQKGPSRVAGSISDRLIASGTAAAANARFAVSTAPHWRLLVKHPSGSLEQAVGSVRRRNLIVSTGILGLLAVSVGFLVASTRRAHDLARQQLEFVATVSHELRTPLAVIRSAADNLADGIVGDEGRVRQYGQLLRHEGIRLSDLVEQILEFAGLQSGQRRLAANPVDVGALLRDVIAAVEATPQAAGLAIELEVAERLPAIAGDELALRRVFQNLVGNAIKYGAKGRWVGVTAGPAAGSGVTIAVSDRGIGIAAADQDRIFNPFYRAPDVVAAQIQGAGLGLSLVRRIIEAHGGRIHVASVPGEGSRFTVILPVVHGDDVPGAVGAAAPQHS